MPEVLRIQAEGEPAEPETRACPLCGTIWTGFAGGMRFGQVQRPGGGAVYWALITFIDAITGALAPVCDKCASTVLHGLPRVRKFRPGS